MKKTLLATAIVAATIPMLPLLAQMPAQALHCEFTLDGCGYFNSGGSSGGGSSAGGGGGGGYPPDTPLRLDLTPPQPRFDPPWLPGPDPEPNLPEPKPYDPFNPFEIKF